MKIKKDMISGVGIAGFCILVYLQTGDLSTEPVAGGLSPAAFPRALAVGVGSLGLLLAGRVAFMGQEDEKEGRLFGPHFGQMLAFFAALVGYILIIPFLGYLAPTTAFLLISSIIIGRSVTFRGLVPGALFSLVVAVAVYYVFAVFLGVPLIEGPVDEFVRYSILGGGS